MACRASRRAPTASAGRPRASGCRPRIRPAGRPFPGGRGQGTSRVSCSARRCRTGARSVAAVGPREHGERRVCRERSARNGDRARVESPHAQWRSTSQSRLRFRGHRPGVASQPVPTRAPKPVPLPRTWRIGAAEIVVVLVANGLLILAMWLRPGGLEQLSTTAGILTAIGQVTALFGTYFALIQLVLMSRSPWLDQAFGMDGLAVAHRWLGFATVWLLLGHGIFTTVGYALGDGSTVIEEFWTLITPYPYVLMATVSGALFAAVAISSIRAARRKLSYETWYGIHLYAYLAIALGFLHQLVVRTHFIADPVAVAYWVALSLVAIALILVFRIGEPVWRSTRHRLRVSHVVTEAPGVISIYMTGRDIDQLAVRSGQYFVWRFLTRDGWWRAHPFSISSAP